MNIIDRLRRTDDGVALMMSLIVIVLATVLSIGVAGSLLAQVKPTQLGRKLVRTVSAAEAGIDVAQRNIRAGESSGVLPCGPFTGEVGAGDGSSYSVTLRYYDRDPTDMPDGWLDTHHVACPAGGITGSTSTSAWWAIATSTGATPDVPGTRPGAGKRKVTAIIASSLAVGVSSCTEDLSRFRPPAGGLTPPGSALPTDAQAACMVQAQPREHRPSNAAYKVTPPEADLVTFREAFKVDTGGVAGARPLADRITGAKNTGTTDEIIQWAAYKWGMDPDILRAIGINESGWYQGDFYNGYPMKWRGFGDIGITPCTAEFPTSRGYWDTPTGTVKYDGCIQTFGYSQFRSNIWRYSYPHTHLSLPFNLDLAGARFRVWWEGYSWCGTQSRGDLGQMIDSHYSGKCYTNGQVNGVDTRYYANWKKHMTEKIWNRTNF